MAENKTEQAKQLIVRYIRDQKMMSGDRLPGQGFFREKFRYGTTTIAAAVRELRDDGVLDVRDKIGVFVVDANANGHIGRTVAVTAVHLEDSMFYSVLSSFLQVHLIRSGNLMRLFCCQAPSPKGSFSIDDYPGLQRCVDGGEIQGIIHLDDFEPKAGNYLKKNGIPSLKIGSTLSADGIRIDFSTIMKQALAKIRSIGCRRPGLIVNAYLFEALESEFKNQCCELWGSVSSAVFSGYNINDGRRIMQEYMNLPREKRPDGLVIMDDILGGTVAAELASVLLPDEMPAAVILRNLQLAIPFPFRRRYYYDVDLNELALIATGVINKAMKTGSLEHVSISYLPKPHWEE